MRIELKTRSIRESFLPFAAPLLGDEEVQGVVECLRSGWLTTGMKVREFETAFAKYIGAKHAIAVNSCTSALHLALEAAGVKPGDEVITSPMTFTATAAVVEHLRAKPVFADIDAETMNIDPAAIEAKITPRTKAILPVHFAGQACDMDAIEAIARRHGLVVVEDAAHAIPTRYQGRLVGTLSPLTCFSFYATKNITTGEGGMVTTDDDRYAARIRLMTLHGMNKDAWKRYMQGGAWAYDVIAPGYKYNLTDVAAAIGLPQLRRCDEFHARRMEIAQKYDEGFASLRGVSTPAVRDPKSHGWHLYVIQVGANQLTIDRDAFIQALGERNIGVSVHFIPLHLQPYYRDTYGLRSEDFPRATAAFHRIISLPLYARMSDADVQDVIDAVTDVAEQHAK
jgi:dTDP-4-amino-4,6-dideoxygalactose transaminase